MPEDLRVATAFLKNGGFVPAEVQRSMRSRSWSASWPQMRGRCAQRARSAEEACLASHANREQILRTGSEKARLTATACYLATCFSRSRRLLLQVAVLVAREKA